MPSSTANQAGRLRAIYYNSAATYASPTWVYVGRISDVQRPQSRSTSDRMYRGKNNKVKVTGYKEFGVSFKYHVKGAGATDTVLDKLQDSFDNDTIIDLALMNGKFLTGTTRVGNRGPFVVAKMDLNEPDEDGVTYDIELVEVDDDSATPIPETTAYSVTTP